MLFIFEGEESLECPLILLVIEDCVVELADDNLTGRPFSFSIRFKTYDCCFGFVSVLRFSV